MTPFPATESTLSAHHLGQFLKEQYCLSANTTCTLFRTGMNHLYLVNDGKNKFVFLVYTFNWRTKMEVFEELRLLNHLKNHNAAIAYPIPDKRKELIQEFHAPEGMRFGVLFSFAEGIKAAQFTPKTSYHIGQALARIHRIAENFEINRITYNSKTLLADALTRTKLFFTNTSLEISFLERLTSFLEKEYEKVDIQKVRRGAVHLDVWFDNIHFSGEHDVTLFDFDFCGNGWLCYDISYFLYQLYTTNQNQAEYEAKAEFFLKGYETEGIITDAERRILPIVCLAVMCYYISIQCDRYDTWSNIFLNEDHLKRMVGNLKRWIIYNNLNIQ